MKNWTRNTNPDGPDIWEYDDGKGGIIYIERLYGLIGR